MMTRDFQKLTNVLSSGAIVAIVLGSIFGLALCIGSIIIVVCIIKHCTQTRYSRAQDTVRQQPYVCPHSWATQYPPHMTSIENYSPEYEPPPPPYTATTSDYTKAPYT